MFIKIFSVIFLGTLIGTVVSLSVQLFLFLVNFLSKVAINSEYNFKNFSEILNFPVQFLFFIIIIPGSIGYLVGKIRSFTKEQRWHGPPDVILAVHTKNNPLNIKTGFLTSFSSILSISAGGSVGQYGPLVHFGATIGAEIKNIFKKVGNYQIFLGAGVAAAISSGFGAPIAGLVFAREVILRHQSLASFSPILISSVIAYFISKTFFGFEPILSSSIGGLNSLKEFPALIFSGLICGIVAVFYMKALTHKKFFPDISKITPTFQPAIAGMICGIVGIFIPEVTGLGTSTILDILSLNISLKLAIYFLIFKLLLTTICLRMGLIGGVFAPALFLGACTGIILGVSFKVLLPDTNIALYAIASMAAVGSCVIGGPVANMMIILELTSDYQATLAAGVSIVFASLISSKLMGQSVFDKVLLNRDIDLEIGDENLILKNLKLTKIKHQDYCTLKENHNTNEAVKILSKSGYSEGYVLDNKQILINKISLPQLLNSKNNIKLKDLKIIKYLKLNSDENIYNAINLCKNFVGESIPIVSQENKILGVIGESDLLKIIVETHQKQMDIEHKS